MTCITPAHSAGAVDITLTNSDMQSGSLASGYTYEKLIGVFQLGGLTKAVELGNSGADLCNSVAVDGSGNFYCAGETYGIIGESGDLIVMPL